MRHFIIIILFMTITFNSSMALNQITWLETSHNFGTFKEENGNVACKIRFVNVGDENVVIEEVRPMCGCTASDFTRQPIASGDTASITLTYNPTDRPGRFSKDVVVITNANPRKSILTIKGNVIGSSSNIAKKYPISIGSLKLNTLTVPFGELKKGQSRTQFIDAYNASKDSLAVEFENVPECVKIAILPSVLLPGDVGTITVFYNTNKKDDWGICTDSVIIKAYPNGNPSKADKSEASVIAIIKEDFSKMTSKELEKVPQMELSTDRIVFEGLEAVPVSKSFRITNRGKNPLIIRKIFTIEDGVEIKLKNKEITKNKSVDVEVTVNPAMLKEKVLNSIITIITNDPVNTIQNVRIVGEKK